MNDNYCKDWNPFIEKGVNPKVLLIGHDPRLQSSDTIANYALFSDYYFDDKPKKGSEKKKFDFATKSIGQVLEITNNKYKADEIYVTNLCNESLPHAPKGKTVLIPESIAKNGFERIYSIICQQTTIEYIFPMSQQVNYWLQFFGLYQTNTDYLVRAKPKEKGINNHPPYYEAVNQSDHPFLEICGVTYHLNTGQKLIPILHTKQYGQQMAYFHCYERIKDHFASFTAQ